MKAMTHPPVCPEGVMAGFTWLLPGREVTATDAEPVEDHIAPRHVLVCGLGRGGTTAVSKALIALGFTTDNPNAFLESVPLRTLNKSQDNEGLMAAIRSWDSRSERLFWKDPKMKAPHLLPVLADLPESVGVIFTFRDPLNVAIRNDALGRIGVMQALEQAIKGYSKMLTTIRAVRNRAVFLVSYEKLLALPELTIGGLAKFLGIDDAEAIRSAIETIEPNCEEYRENVKASKRNFTRPQHGAP